MRLYVRDSHQSRILRQEQQLRRQSIDDVAAALVEEYEIDENLARKDAQAWCDKIAECGLLVKEEDEPLFSNGKNE